jgi:hypothetical protein
MSMVEIFKRTSGISMPSPLKSVVKGKFSLFFDAMSILACREVSKCTVDLL